MKINYKLIRKIHLYACLSTAAVFLMFIFTSYLMIHHSWFDHEQRSESTVADIDAIPASEEEWKALTGQYDIQGRLIREHTDNSGNLVREYARAAGSTRITCFAAEKRIEIVRNAKSKADAIIGIHRQRGYGGPIQYSLYAFMLDLIGVSLIVFTVTGIIMWFRLLKNSRIAWIIFISGFIYFSIAMALLIYW